MEITTGIQLAEKAVQVAKNYKTLYVMGCFGAPMNPSNKKRYTDNHSYNRQISRASMINNATTDTFGFDCVCFIKGLLWGWDGDVSKSYGGAIYLSNNVPDIGSNEIINICKDISSDFNKVEVGEIVWMKDHVGIYIGDGLVVECTPQWTNNVQITACNCRKDNYNTRNWVKHGKLPYVSYDDKNINNTTQTSSKAFDTVYIVKQGDVLSNIAKKYNITWQKLAEYNNIKNPNIINIGQKIKIPSIKSINSVVKEVINGKWGNGEERKRRLQEAGYDYSIIQEYVNKMCEK